MRFSDQFRTGWRNLGRQKLRSTLTIFAIVIGALSVTVMLSMVTSAKGFLNSSLEKTGEDRRVIATRIKGLDYQQAASGDTGGDDEGSVLITDDVVNELAAIPGVSTVTPVLTANLFQHVSVDGRQIDVRYPRVLGYQPNGTVKHDLAAGEELSEANGANGGVLISTPLAHALGFRGSLGDAIGRTFTLEFDSKMQQFNSGGDPTQCPPGNRFPDCANNQDNVDKCNQNPGPDCKQVFEAAKQADAAFAAAKGGGKPRSLEPLAVRIVGVYVSDSESVESTITNLLEWSPPAGGCDPGDKGSQQAACYSDREVLRKGYSAVYLAVTSKRDVDAVAQQVERTRGLGSASGKESAAKQNQTFTIVGAVLGGIGGIALLVAAIGVINTMVMATLERTREIGIMRALGATKRTIKRLFTVEAAFLGFLGGAVGVGISFAVMIGLNQIVNRQLEHSGVTARDVMEVPIGLAIIVIAGTTLIGVIAGRLPARRAANLDPVEALRYE